MTRSGQRSDKLFILGLSLAELCFECPWKHGSSARVLVVHKAVVPKSPSYTNRTRTNERC